jgi:hypothetical protein
MEGFVFLGGQPVKNGGLIFYCGTSMGVGESLGIPTGVGLRVWVSGLVLVSFFSFSFHLIESCPNTTANMISSYILLYKSQKDLERLPNAHSFNLSQQPRAFSNTTHEIIRNSKPKMPKYHHLFVEFRWEKNKLFKCGSTTFLLKSGLTNF